MIEPPLHDADPTATSAPRSGGNRPGLGQRITEAMRSEDLSYALDYRDPTGEAGIRAAAQRIRDALGWQPRTVNKLVMGPSKLPIHISDDLCERLFVFLAIEAEINPTNSGKGFRARTKEETPTGTAAKHVPGEGHTNHQQGD